MPETTALDLPSETFQSILKKAQNRGMTAEQYLSQLYGGEHVEITNVEDLMAMASAERERTFTLHGKKVKIRMRALNADESAEVDKIQAAIIPPKTRDGMPNEDDPDYRQRLHKARKLQRASVFDLCVLSFKLKGDTLQERADFLYKSLPPGVIDGIWRGVLELTADPIENALFT